MANLRRVTTRADLSFEAALVQSSRKALTLDCDGEAVLTLAIPASDAIILASRFIELMDRSFVVTIALS